VAAARFAAGALSALLCCSNTAALHGLRPPPAAAAVDQGAGWYGSRRPLHRLLRAVQWLLPPLAPQGPAPRKVL
jgi:hypothetical protein